MVMHPARQHMSVEQYLLLVNNSDRHYEYYDGEVRLMAGGSSNHAAIALNFGIALDQALGDDAVCRPYVSDKLVRERVGSTSNTEPGNAFIWRAWILKLRCASFTGVLLFPQWLSRWQKKTN